MRWDIGIDLGTEYVRMAEYSRGATLEAAARLAFREEREQPLCCGDVAARIAGRTCAGVKVVSPLKDGVLENNFYADRMVDFASFNRIKPMVNQVEAHIFDQQKTAKEWMDKYGVQIEAWAPFGEGRGGIFENPVIADIAAKHRKTPAQVMLRWHIQRGVVVIPKSTHKERMEENFQVFDFALTDEDMLAISALDKGESAFFSHQDPAMVEWFVRMVEERKTHQ